MGFLYRLTPIHLDFLFLNEHLRGTANGGLSCSHLRSSPRAEDSSRHGEHSPVETRSWLTFDKGDCASTAVPARR
jgi:hypothetical protein